MAREPAIRRNSTGRLLRLRRRAELRHVFAVQGRGFSEDGHSVRVVRKQFFFEKRTKKLLLSGMRTDRARRVNQQVKVFWFFSSEKNCFLPYLSTHIATPIPPPRTTWRAPSSRRASAFRATMSPARGAGGADRVTDGDGAAIYVHLGRVEPESFTTASDCAAKASLLSMRSRSAMLHPARCRALRLLGMGRCP